MPGVFQQVWFCLVCHTCGSIIVDSDAGVYEVLDKIRIEHKNRSRYASETPLQPAGIACAAEPQVINHWRSV